MNVLWNCSKVETKGITTVCRFEGGVHTYYLNVFQGVCILRAIILIGLTMSSIGVLRVSYFSLSGWLCYTPFPQGQPSQLQRHWVGVPVGESVSSNIDFSLKTIRHMQPLCSCTLATSLVPRPPSRGMGMRLGQTPSSQQERFTIWVLQ